MEFNTFTGAIADVIINKLFMIHHHPFRRIVFFTTFLLFSVSRGFSQLDYLNTRTYSDSTRSYVEIAGYANSISRTPFWLQSNQFGIVPAAAQTVVSARAGIESYLKLSEDTKNGKPGWRVGGGIEVVGNIANQSKALLPQAFAAVRFKDWELSAGRKKQWMGIADSTMGLGSYTWSGNAMPIPAIYFGTNKFIPVPFTKGVLSFNGSYSDGWFESGRPVTSELKLHQKSLFLRIGKETSTVKLYGGFVHQVQWGGRSPYETVNGQMPKGFKNYLNVIFGTLNPDGDDLTDFDGTNRVGNHLGSLDMGMEIETYGSTIFLYRQSFIEDGSLFYLNNVMDGLHGLRIKRKNSYGANFEVTEALLEFFNSKSQGGAEFVMGVGKYRGKDDYFHHVQVRDGWSYYNRTIGSPVIPPTSETSWKWPSYFFTSNNRVSALHLGLRGTFLQDWKWHTKLTYTHNLGTYNAHFGEGVKQFSGFLAIERPILSSVMPGLIGQVSGAFDSGKLFRNSSGVMVSIRKMGLF